MPSCPYLRQGRLMTLQPQIIQAKFKKEAKKYTSYPLSQVVEAFRHKDTWYVRALRNAESWSEYKHERFERFFKRYKEDEE